MTNKEVMQQALDALKWCYDVTDWPASGDTPQDKAIKALRTALAQPESDEVLAEREACLKEISVEINDEIEDEAYCILVALLARIRARGQG